MSSSTRHCCCHILQMIYTLFCILFCTIFLLITIVIACIYINTHWFSDPFKGTLRFKESVLINHKERDDLILNVDSTYSKLQHKDTILVFFQGKLLLTVGKTGNRVRYSVNKEFKNAPVTLAEHPAGETSFNFKMRIPHCLADQYGGFTLTMYHKGSELDQRSIHMGGTGFKSMLIEGQNAGCDTVYHTSEKALRVGCVIEDYPRKPTVRLESPEGRIEIGNASTTNITRGGDRCFYNGNDVEHTVNLKTIFTSLLCQVNSETCHVVVYNPALPYTDGADCFTYYGKLLLICGAVGVALLGMCLVFWCCYKKCYPKSKTLSLPYENGSSTKSSVLYHLLVEDDQSSTDSESNNHEYSTCIHAVPDDITYLQPVESARSDEDAYLIPVDHTEPGEGISGVQSTQNNQLSHVVCMAGTHTQSGPPVMQNARSMGTGLAGGVRDSISVDSDGYCRGDRESINLDSNGYCMGNQESTARDSSGYYRGDWENINRHQMI